MPMLVEIDAPKILPPLSFHTSYIFQLCHQVLRRSITVRSIKPLINHLSKTPKTTNIPKINLL